MAYEIVLPQLGLAMETGRIVRWLKQPGDTVAVGEVLLEVESDKAVVEVESVAAGQLHIVAGSGTGEVKVGSVIGYILADGERPPGAGVPARPAVALPAAAVPADVIVTPEGAPVAPLVQRLPSSPAARRRAKELQVDWRQAQATGPAGRVKVRDVERLAQALPVAAVSTAAALSREEPGALHISPLARDLAEALGVSSAALADRFPGKRVQREDVEQLVRELLKAATPAAAPPGGPAGAGAAAGRRPVRRQALTGLRRLIAERMSQSSQTTASVTLQTEVDATELARLRETLRDQPDGAPAPSYNVLLAKIVACALALDPGLNASLEAGEIVQWASANIGIAVDTERGLVVPVLQDVGAKSLSQLAREAEDLLARARAGKATPDELSGGTFTLTNLGHYGVDGFTPIINPPEAAILGVGRLRRTPAFDDQGNVTPRLTLWLSLTFDHRLVDGAPAARFLQRVAQYVEQPYLWLVR